MNTNIHMAIINQTRRPCGSSLIKQGFFEFKESFYSEFTCTDHTLTPTDSLLPPRSRAGSDHRSGYKRDYPRFNPRSRVGSDCTSLTILIHNELECGFCETPELYRHYALLY